MERQILNYQTNLTPYLAEEIQAYNKRESVDLLTGQAGLALYSLGQWMKTGQSRNLLQTQLCLKKALLGINNLYEETSFHAGPLGILWVNYLFEEQTNSKIIDDQLVLKILHKYISTQKEKTIYENHVLDFLYGVTGWFVIYPYLPIDLKKHIKDHFIEKVQKKGESFLAERGYLGFSHGLASILYMIKEYKIDELTGFYQQFLPVLLDTSRSGKIPRIYQGEDFLRQDWCHGAIGAALVEKENTKFLKAFFDQKLDSQSHGICHGVGSRILVSKLLKRVFSSDYRPNLVVSSEIVTKDEVKFYFLESFMVAQMAIDLTEDSEFHWWRIVYPVNIE